MNNTAAGAFYGDDDESHLRRANESHYFQGIFERDERHNDEEEAQAVWITVAQHLLLALLTISTIMGNSFIIVMIGSHRQLQRPSHILLGCLASTDLLLGLTVMVPRLVTELSGGKWVFGFLLCQGYHAMDVTLSTASILHLSCISIDRYFAIVHRPLLYHSRVTPCRVVLASFFCWILSSLTGFVPVFTGIYTSMEHLEKARLNPADCADLVVNKYFSVVAGIISFWLPGSIMVYVYCKVYKETMRLRREERKVTVSLRESPKAAAAASMACKNSVDGDRNSKTAVLSRHFCPQSWKLSNGTSSKATDKKKCKFKYGKKASISVKEESNENAIEVEIVEEEQERREEQTSAQIQKQQQRINRERESGAAKTVGIVMGIFLVCWTPFFIWMPVTALFELNTPPILYSLILWIGYGNSVVNPFVYGFFSREFRSVISKSIFRKN